jgi:hypothetical protein
MAFLIVAGMLFLIFSSYWQKGTTCYEDNGRAVNFNVQLGKATTDILLSFQDFEMMKVLVKGPVHCSL